MVDAAFLDIRTESNNDVVKIMEANGTVPNRSAVPDGNLVVENDARIHLGIEGDHRKGTTADDYGESPTTLLRQRDGAREGKGSKKLGFCGRDGPELPP
ncbi:hypothetical protein HPP92_021050 [Vanilla planifolia]|uniref:Uncharacterized protein n=1 Tax=Vanilla planifolia TaxID=51239 RepID=A0A835PZ51_VANPL|nr:hypothetical protein HPP92_021050 [Vanilla planifolia]